MAKQQPKETPAEFVNKMGWKVGDVLYGAPTDYESSRIIKITAIGLNSVLAVQGPTFGRSEGFWTFDEREWYPHTDAFKNRDEIRRRIGELETTLVVAASELRAIKTLVDK
jgi:hypothetical protein